MKHSGVLGQKFMIKILKKVLLLSIIGLSTGVCLTDFRANHAAEYRLFPTLTSLIESFKRLPANRLMNEQEISKQRSIFAGIEDKALARAEFQKAMQNWMSIAAGRLKNGSWCLSNRGIKKPHASFFSTLKFKKFQPFVQRIVAQPGQHFIMRGDLHGDILSLVTQLEDMQKEGLIGDNFKLKPGVKFVVLGDYVDRGIYGAEVLYTLARLVAANPDDVVCVRGNHEDLNLGYQYGEYGFPYELKYKFGDHDGSLYAWIGNIYNLLPVVVYLGDDKQRYVQLCHGGIEQGYQPELFLRSDNDYQLIGALHRARSLQAIIQDPNISQKARKEMQALSVLFQDNVVLEHPCSDRLPLGFMWNDFDPEGKGLVVRQHYRGLEYGQEGVNVVLNQQAGTNTQIIGIIRGHQHSTDPNDKMMRNLRKGDGVCNMRNCCQTHQLGADVSNKDVLTLNVAPDTFYGQDVGFEDDTSIQVTPIGVDNQSWQCKKRKHYPFSNSSYFNP